MSRMTESLNTCLKYALNFLLFLSIFCSPPNSRFLDTSESTTTEVSTPPFNETATTATDTLSHHALFDQLETWIPPSRILPRAGDHTAPKPATDAQLTDAAAKGCNLLYMMAANAADALTRMQTNNPKLKSAASVQSTWTNAWDLKKYGWTDKKDTVNWGYAGVNDVMQELKIDRNDKDNSNIQLLQYTDVTVDGTTYKASTGVYNQYINTKAGLLMPYYVYSPEHEGARNGRPKPYVPLAKYSDVLFLYWSKLCGRSKDLVCNLNYFAFLNVQNANTWALVQRIMQKKTGKTAIPDWPGAEFSMNQPEGKALLSSQLGTPLAWFLIQHKAQLGASKIVTKVRIFRNKSMTNRDTDWPYPSVLFYVEDGPADTHCNPTESCCCPTVK